ncbi:MAG: hypothetical protein K5899_04565 [Bacteroidaceae bacterium]|nr:hypothetical protein [Bacteroidaceae bacterium]
MKLNTDGPGGAGTARIGKYLLAKNYDLVMMQEDFNYHDVLTVMMEDVYGMDEWSGEIGIEDRKIDFLHLQNHRFECDGLMACWKKDFAGDTLRTHSMEAELWQVQSRKRRNRNEGVPTL